jgi:ribosomal protein L27
MKTIKSLVLILIISCTVQGSFAQKIFRDGYIVKKTGESLTGLVQYSDKQGIPSECTFKRFDIAREVVYAPSDIQAFGYRNGNRYESREIDNKVTFLEVIATGKIILYQKGSKYYIDKDHLGLVELKNGPVIYNSNEGKKEFKNLPSFLTSVTEGKAGSVPEKFNVKEDIVPLVITYNKASGNSYNVFNRSISEKQLTQETWKSGASKNRFGVMAGVNMYKLNLKFNPDMYGITNEDYVPNPEKETGPVFGLTYERLISRRSDRFSIRIDMLFNSQDFYCYSERENNVGGITRDETNFSFSGLKFPILFQYSLTGGRIVPYVNAGVAYQYFLSTDYHHVAEQENTFHEIFTYHDSNMLFKSGELTGAGGLGVRTRIFSSINIHLMYMFEYGKGLFINTDPTDTNNRKNDPYVENSLQSTFMLGITF